LNLPLIVEIRVNQNYILDAFPIVVELTIILLRLLGNLLEELVELPEAGTVLEEANHHIKIMITCQFFDEIVMDGREVIVDQNLLLFRELFYKFLALGCRSIFLIVEVDQFMRQTSFSNFFAAQ
jgi:hypothetical protein